MGGLQPRWRSGDRLTAYTRRVVFLEETPRLSPRLELNEVDRQVMAPRVLGHVQDPKRQSFNVPVAVLQTIPNSCGFGQQPLLVGHHSGSGIWAGHSRTVLLTVRCRLGPFARLHPADNGAGNAEKICVLCPLPRCCPCDPSTGDLGLPHCP